MADDNVQKRQVRRYTWAQPSGGQIGPAGISADELKVSQTPAKLPPLAIAPIAQRGPVEFVAPTSSSETLRLAVPQAAHPFETPTGPRHDHMHIRKALARSQGATRRQLVALLKSPPSTLKPEDVERMGAAVMRVKGMDDVLRPRLEWQERIYAILAGQSRDV